MEDDWIFLGDGGAGGSDTDSASDAGSDTDSGFTMIVRRGRKGGDAAGRSVVVSDDAPRVPAVALPHPTPPGLSVKLVSYAEAFSAGGAREQQPGCNDDEVTAGEAIVQGAGIDDAAGTASTDDCTVTCKEGGCESGSDQGGEHVGTGSSVEAPSVVNCPETTAVLHGEAHSDSEMDVDQDGAEEVEEDEDSESCKEDADDGMENSSEDEDTDSSGDDDTDSSGDDDTDSSGDEDITFISSDEETEEYTEIFTEEEEYTAEVYSEEDEDDDDDAECSGEEEEDDGSESSGEQVDYVESSGEEEDAESTGEEEGDDDPEISGEDKEGSNAECSGEEDDVESSGDDESDDSDSSGKEEESSHVVDVAENDCSDMDTDSSGSGSDMDTESCDMENDDCLESHEQDYIVDVAEKKNQDQDIFAMLLPKDKTSGPNMEDGDQDIFAVLLPKEKASGANMEDGNQDIFAMLFPKEKACGSGTNMDGYENETKHGYIHDFDDDDDDDDDDDEEEEEEEEEEDGSLFDIPLSRDHAIDDDIDTESSDMDYIICLDSDEEDGIVNVKEILDMLLLPPRALASDDDIDSSDGEDESATATAASDVYSAESSHGTRRPEFAGRAARGYDDIDTDSDMEQGDDEVVVAAHVNGTSPCWGLAFQSQAERQAMLEDLQRHLAAEALVSSGQPQQLRSYDDVDDTCDVPGTATPGGGPPGRGSCTCATTPEPRFTARDTERELAMEEARRREAAQLELDRALAREAAVAAEALELALENCATAERQATVDVTRPAVAKQADVTFIIGVYALVFLVVSLLSRALPSN